MGDDFDLAFGDQLPAALGGQVLEDPHGGEQEEDDDAQPEEDDEDEGLV
jgi:hypothetical protein